MREKVNINNKRRILDAAERQYMIAEIRVDEPIFLV